MRATLLKQGEKVSDPIDPTDYGRYVDKQDPLTGEIVRVWEPYPDDQTTPDVNETATFGTIKCLARGIVDGGIRVAGTTERFGDTYENIDYVKMWLPARTIVTKRDRITNITNPGGHVLWIDEEYDDNNPLTLPKASMYNVNGVTPLFDAFNKLVEWFVLLERAQDISEVDL